MKETCRLELKCYVDSWNGPISGSGGEESRPCIYAFKTPDGLTKIGSTRRPVSRLYQLRVGPSTSYSPPKSQLGRYLHLEPAKTEGVARRAERLAHRILTPFRYCRDGRANWNVEWYEVEDILATRALKIATAIVEGEFANMELAEIRQLINQK